MPQHGGGEEKGARGGGGGVERGCSHGRREGLCTRPHLHSTPLFRPSALWWCCCTEPSTQTTACIVNRNPR